MAFCFNRPVVHVGKELHLRLDGGDFLGRRGLRPSESEERHCLVISWRVAWLLEETKKIVTDDST